MADFAVFSPELAREIVDAVRYLRSQGFALQGSTSKTINATSPTPIYVKNIAASTAPAYGCMQVVGTVEAGGQNYLEVTRPTDDSGTAGPYVFNGPRSITTNAFGIAFDGPVVRSKVNGTITENGKYAPRVNNWDITAKTGGPFTCLGADDVGADIAKVWSGPIVSNAAISAVGRWDTGNTGHVSGNVLTSTVDGSITDFSGGEISLLSNAKQVGFQIDLAGIYTFVLNVTLTSSSVGTGDDLVIKIANGRGARTMSVIDLSGYGGGVIRTEECVSCSGVLEVTSSGASVTATAEIPAGYGSIDWHSANLLCTRVGD